MNAITDKEKIKEVLTRGVELIYPSYDDLERKLLSGKKLKLYCGFDPSAPALHIGNAIQLNKLSQFQKLGHEVIFLIGDFTGMIGDPTDKTSVRKKMTREEVKANARDYKEQAAAYLDFEGDNPAKVLYNSEWNDKLAFKDVIELSSNFTVQQMIQRDMFQKRIEEEKPIHLHEFLYPLTQGYDSVAMDVDLEVGGNDQMFNMMCGRDLMKALGKKDKSVMTMKLLADDKGKKMGKSEGNAVFLNVSPNDMFGTVMSWPDGVIVSGFELCTRIPMPEVHEIKKGLKAGVNPRDSKMRLAFEITAMNHGREAASAAQDYFIQTFAKKEIPDDMPEIEPSSYDIMAVLIESGLCSSKSEARRLIEQNGVKVNEKAVSDLAAPVSKGDIVQKGKRFFVKIK